MKTLTLLFCSILFSLTLTPSQAQSPTGTVTGSASHAVDVAEAGVDASIRDHVVSVYGVGTPTAIQTWWVIFYDPSVPSHGRAVKVDNGQVTRAYEAKGGVVYADALTFAPSQVTDESAALGVAQDYAAKHALAYDQVHALLRITEKNQNFRWRVQLMNGSVSKGFVFVNANDGTFAMYSPPGSVHSKDSTETGGGVVGDIRKAGNEVKNTFLGVGGDLQQFFTGERTVDQ